MLKKIISLKLILIALILGSTLSFSGCAQDSGSSGLESILGLGILAWQLGVFDKGDGDSNNPPQILTLTATPNTISIGGSTLLSCVAFDSDSGDNLSYVWTTGAGTLDTPNAASTIWVAPTNNSGTYYVNVTVSDGKKSVTGKVPIVVNVT